jgi:hypothetical protein
VRRLAIALCLLMEASTGNAQFFVPQTPNPLQALFGACLGNGFNADHCECWVNQMSSILTPQDILILQLDGKLPHRTKFEQFWANATCQHPNSTAPSRP